MIVGHAKGTLTKPGYSWTSFWVIQKQMWQTYGLTILCQLDWTIDVCIALWHGQRNGNSKRCPQKDSNIGNHTWMKMGYPLNTNPSSYTLRLTTTALSTSNSWNWRGTSSWLGGRAVNANDCKPDSCLRMTWNNWGCSGVKQRIEESRKSCPFR